MAKETVLITGASSGIGLELAGLFAAGKSDLVLAARSEGKLKEIAGGLGTRHGIQARVYPADLMDPAAPQALYDRLKSDGVAIDVLVNNAGFGAIGPFAKLDVRRQIDMIQLNVTALTHLTRLFVADLIARRRGGILNVASTAAFQPGPNMAVYYATKAYVLSFTEALAEELKGSGVTVTCFCPGPTRTGFQEVANSESARMGRLGYMDAATVATAGYRAFRAGRVVAIPGLINKLLPQGERLMPRVLVRKVAANFNVVD